MIGAYGVTFSKRSLFIYKTVAYKNYTMCEGYFIRKKEWLEIINNEDHEDVIKVYKT